MRTVNSLPAPAAGPWRRWTRREDGVLLDMVSEGASLRAVARVLGRTAESVRWRLYRLARREMATGQDTRGGG